MTTSEQLDNLGLQSEEAHLTILQASAAAIAYLHLPGDLSHEGNLVPAS